MKLCDHVFFHVFQKSYEIELLYCLFYFYLIKITVRPQLSVNSSLNEGHQTCHHLLDRKSEMFFYILCGRGISYTTTDMR